MVVSSAPARCFYGCGNLGELLFLHVHGGIRWLANNLSIGMGAMIERMASRMAASLPVGDNMFVLQTSWLIVKWLGF